MFKIDCINPNEIALRELDEIPVNAKKRSKLLTQTREDDAQIGHRALLGEILPEEVREHFAWLGKAFNGQKGQ
jgi:hypothetical protein